MLSDRPYMRDDYQREKTSILVWLLSAIIAGFAVQSVFSAWLGTTGFENTIALSAAALKRGYVWTLLTYPLLHRSVLHLLVVVLSIFFVGREISTQVGERRLAWLALSSAAVGGLVWFGVHFNRGDEVVGATTILWCYFTVFACLFANRKVSFLIFFVIPVTTRPKYILWTVAALDVCGFLFSELPGRRYPGVDFPFSAHLGAMLIGWIYYRYVHQATWPTFRPPTEFELPRWLRRPKKPAAEIPVPVPAQIGGGSRDEIRAEVDRILDKINSNGFGSLSADERRVLDDAKDSLSRR